ncbi:heterokaryon incompatibility protein-domain-containing protein [Tricladium varicosporioides]|nr:heterokaryon incompatibility protein-domain-containing protein [Hymenoscyphus varicosporioides]
MDNPVISSNSGRNLQNTFSRLFAGLKMNDYQYSPLNGATGEIRLLTLLPGRFSSKIRIALDTALCTETEVPEFEALSYTWGSKADLVDIYIGDNRRLAVTQNLAEALRYLRHKKTPRTLWIDAICINQQDVSERSKQVKRMDDIYLKATRVVVWLGPEADDSTLVLELMAKLSSEVNVDRDNGRILPISGNRTKYYWADTREDQPFEDIHLSPILKLLARPWFERLWVLQEIYLGKENAIVMCGDQTIPWMSLNNAIYCMDSKPLPYPDFHTFDPMLTRISETFDARHNIPFFNLINSTQHCKCLDPRDRIYAIQSMMTVQERLGLEPDYSKTVLEVYQDVFLRHIDDKRYLHLLADAGITKENDWPTWVPNWSIPRTSVRLTGWCGSSESLAITEFKDGELNVTGVSVTAIKLAVPFYKWNNFVGDRMRELRRVLSCCGFTNQLDYNSTQIRAICETLCGNNFEESYQPRKSGCSTLKEAEGVVRKVINSPHDSFGFIGDTGKLDFLLRASVSCNGRAFVILENGHVGLAPSSAQVGDIMTVMLGFDPAMILRPNKNGTYKVVGEGYCQGVMSGEALLGPLPGNFRVVEKRHKSGWITWAYHDDDSGLTHVEDPRLGPLPAAWKRKTHNSMKRWTWYVNDETGEEFKHQNGDPRLTPTVLKEMGVDLKCKVHGFLSGDNVVVL